MKFVLTKDTTAEELNKFLAVHQSVYEVSSTLLAQLLVESKLLNGDYILSVNDGTLVFDTVWKGEA